MLPKPIQLLASLPLYFLAYLLLSVPQVSAATIGLSPASTSLQVGQTTTITVGINTETKNTVGADTHINFNSSLVEIQSVSFSGSPYSQNFSNNTGSLLKLTSSFASPSDSYTGSTNIATITLKALATGTANFSFACTAGATNDTNVVERLTGADLVNCGSLGTTSINITQSSGPAPTPTPTPPATPTNNPNNPGTGSTCNLPTAPTNLRSAPNSSDSVLLTWDHSTSGAEHYSLFYGPNANQLYYSVGNIGYTNNFLVSHLSPNSTYAFGIAAVNTCGQSETIFTLNKTLGTATVKATSPTPNLTTTKPAGFGNLATNTKKGDQLAKEPTKIIADESPTASPTPGPYTYQEPVAQPQTRTIALAAAVLIPILLLLWLLFGRKKKKKDNLLDQNELNMPPVETLTPPPTPTNTYSNLTDPNQHGDNPNNTQIN